MRWMRGHKVYGVVLAGAVAFAWQGAARAETVTIEAGADCNTLVHAEPHNSKLELAAGTLILKPSANCMFMTDATTPKAWDVGATTTPFPASAISASGTEIKVTYDFADGKAHCIRFDVTTTATGNARDKACYTPPPSPAP